MSKVHVARSGFLTKAALPSVTRSSGEITATYFAAVDDAAGSTTLTDTGTITFTETFSGSAIVSSSQAKFGSTSVSLPSTGSYVTIGSNSGMNPGSNSFCLEFWLYMTSMPAAIRELVAINNSTSAGVDGFAGIRLVLNPNGSMYYLCGSSTTLWINNSTTAAGVITTGTWYHIAAVRNGTAFNLYVDGVSKLNYTSSTTIYDYSGTSYIGAIRSYGNITGTGLNGFIDCIRYFNGQAVYTTAFTPPSTVLTNSISSGTITNNVYGVNQVL